jgi:RHS repeat-associated protein
MEKKWLSSLLILLLLLSSSSEILAFQVKAQNGSDTPTLMGSGFMWPGSSGTQVDMWDGSLTLSRTEAELPSRVPILIAFTYFSRLCSVFSQYGYGWRFNHNIFYEDNEDETTVVWGNGGAAKFVKDKVNGGYINTPGVTDKLEEYVSNQFVLTTKDKFKFYFDNANHKHVTRVMDRSGNSILFTYDRFNLLTKITDDSSTLSVYFYYDDDGMLKDVRMPNRDITFAYDNQQNLITVNTLNSTTYETVYQSKYSYDSEHYLKSISDPSERITTVAYSHSRVSHIASPLIDTQVAYDTSGNKTTIVERTDNIEQTTIFYFDSQGRCLKTQDDQGGIVTYEWDGNNVVSITDQKGNVTRYEYDASRNPIVITDATGSVTRYTYKANSNDPISYTDARGYSWNYTYNSSGQLIQKTDPTGNYTTYSYDIYGDQTEIDYPIGSVVYNYNDFGAVTRETYSTGYYVNYSYDNSGNLLSVTDQIGNTIFYEYDLMNRIVSITNRQGLKTQYSYDAFNNLAKRIDPGNRVTFFEYDALDRVTKVVDSLNQTNTYNYNATGHTKTFTDSLGHTTIFTYDTLNRLISEQDPLGNRSSYTYDALDNVLSFTDPNGNITRFSYDALNRLIREDYSDGNQVHYSYDQIGNILTLSDSHATLNYTYDALSRLTEVKDLTHNKKVSYSYDAMGNVKSLIDPFGRKTSYTYDEQDRVTSILDPDNQVTNFYYNELGWLAQKHFPNGIIAYYGYDNDGKLTDLSYQNSTGQIMLHYVCEYDQAGTLFRTIKDGDVTLFSYDSLNRLVSVTYSNQSTVSYGYDACGSRVNCTTSGGTVNYLYDAANRLLQTGDNKYEWDKSGNLIAKTSSGGKTTYQYNAANELTSIGYPDSTITNYEYYPDGRLISKTSGANQTCYIYSGQNVLYETKGDWTPTAEYNSIGIDDAISVKQAGNYYFYLYDYVGSVVGVANSSEQLVSTCSYDPFGVPSVSGNFPNSHLFINREYDPKSQLYNLRARYYDPFTGRFISKDPLPNYVQPYLYASDNPVMLADPSGFIQQRALEPLADQAPSVNTPTSMEQRREFWENLAQNGLEDPCGYAGYWKYTVGKWESGLISEMQWLKKNWKGILYGLLGISGTGAGATGLGLSTGVIGSRGAGPEPIYLCLESTYIHTLSTPPGYFTSQFGPGGVHLGMQGNWKFAMKDWGPHVGIPKHFAETELGKILTSENFGIIGKGPTYGSSTYHYFPVKAGAQAVILIGFFAAPIVGLKGCDRIKEPPIEWNPNAHLDVIDSWQYKNYLKSNPYSDGWWDELVIEGTFELVEQGTNITGSADTWYLATIHRPDGSFYYYGPFNYHYPNIRASVSGNKLDVIFNPEGYDIDHRYWYGLTAYINRISTRGEGTAHYDWNPPEGVAENVSEIRVNTNILVNSQPDSIEPRSGPRSDITVVLLDAQTGQPFSWGGPLTFENYSPDLADLSGYVDLGPQAKITANVKTSEDKKLNANGLFPLAEVYPSGEIIIGVKGPHVLESNFSIIVSPTSIWHVAADGSGDFSTIQGAIDAALPGDLINVGYGIYNETILVNKRLTIDAPGSYPTINAGKAGNAIVVSADNVTISGFKIINSSNAYPHSGIFLDHVSNTMIKENEICENGGYGIFEIGGSNNTISNNQIHDNSMAGLRIDGYNSNSTVTYNSLYDNQQNGIFVYGAQRVLVDSNSFYHNGACGATIQGGSQNITFSNNGFGWNTFDGLSVFYSTNIRVDTNEFVSDMEYGIYLFESNNNTIQNNKFMATGAMANMGNPTGDGIYVWNSTGNKVTENTVIEDWRSETGKPIVYLENENSKFITNASQVILVNCTNITIKELNATKVDVGLELWQTNTTKITNCTFKENLYGIVAYNSTGNQIYNCSFIGNTQSQAYIPTIGFPNAWDNGSQGNYWSNYIGQDSNHDGIGDQPYQIDADNIDRYPITQIWTTPPVAYLVVRGADNQIYYRTYNSTSTTWNSWKTLPGSTNDSPAAAVCGNELHVVVRGADGISLYHGYVTLSTNTFSGWTWITGTTPSPPALVSNGTALTLVVRGADNCVYYRVYTVLSRSWGGWHLMGSGSTCDKVSAVMSNNQVFLMIRGFSTTDVNMNNTLWTTTVNVDAGSYPSWSWMPGSVTSSPTLANWQNGNGYCLVVRGTDNSIYINKYVGSVWQGWTALSSGSTTESPAATVIGDKLYIVVVGMDHITLWTSNKDLNTNAFSGWSWISGTTPSKPLLIS